MTKVTLLMGGSKQGWTDKQGGNTPGQTLGGATGPHDWAAAAL